MGSYPITVAIGTLADANYRFLLADGTFAVGLPSQPIVFRPLAPVVWGDPDFDLVATGGGSANPVTFSSSNPEVAVVTGATVHLVGAGEATIVAHQDGDDRHAVGSATQRLVVSPATLVVAAHDAARRDGEPNPELPVRFPRGDARRGRAPADHRLRPSPRDHLRPPPAASASPTRASPPRTTASSTARRPPCSRARRSSR